MSKARRLDQLPVEPGAFLSRAHKARSGLGSSASTAPSLVTPVAVIDVAGDVASVTELMRFTNDLADWLRTLAWIKIVITESPLLGGDGSREFLIGAIKSA